MWAASPALKSLVHLDRALRIAVSASPAGCADTAVAAAISKNPHQASSRFTLSDRSGRLLQDIGDGGTPYNTGEIGGDPGMTRTCDLRFRKPPLYPAELRDRAPRRQAPTDCGFLAGPGFNRYPCGRVEMRSAIRPDPPSALTARVATARKNETGEFSP